MLATPLGWSVLAAFSALAGAIFGLSVFQSGAPATLRGVFIALGWAVLATAPALSMRSVAEERRHGTWAALLAAPSGASAAIIGKFLALLAFLTLAVCLPAAAQVTALEFVARPDYGEILTAVCGLLLAGAAYIASGILMSALTGNQVGAYLLTLFLWLTWIVLAKAAPAVLSAQGAYTAFSLDPLRRLDDFLLGVLDSGNAIFFLGIAAWFLTAAVLVVTRPVLPASRAGLARALIAVGASGVLVVSIIGIANAPAARGMLDMTKTRAYTLAPSTQQLLAGLSGEWTVAVLLNAGGADPAVLRQIDEVLARMGDQRKGELKTVRVDPTNPADAAKYEEILEAIQTRDRTALEAHGRAIAAGLQAFGRLVDLAAVQQGELVRVIQSLPADSPDRTELDSLRAAFAQLTQQKAAFDKSLAQLRTANDSRPFPDEARAAAAVAANVRHWGEQLQAAAVAMSQRQRERIEHTALAQWIESAIPAFIQSARELRAAQDLLEQLPTLYGAAVGGALATGDAAVIIGPPGITVIPGAQLVAGAGGRGAVSFDRRFRGEQLVAAAIRSMSGGPAPVAVIVHSGELGLLRPRADHADFAAAADALRAARIDVAEWVPGEGLEPIAPQGRPLVWIIVPPAERQGMQESPRERALLAATERLVARGEPVLLSIGPSLLPMLGKRDPWADVLAERGLGAITGRSVLEVVPIGPGRAQTVAEQLVRDFASDHPLGSAVTGQLTRFDSVVAVQPELRPNGRSWVIAAIEPSSERWMEGDWRREQRPRLEAPADKRLTEPVPVVVATQIPGSGSRSAAPVRTLLVGSPTWLVSSVADAADALGGGRVALRYPGNRELLVNSVAWLSGRDDLVAAAGSGREVNRIPQLSSLARLAVSLLEGVGLPMLIAALGATIVLRRRWRT